LLSVSRVPGCKLKVSSQELSEPDDGRDLRPLYGPILWSWWLRASRLPAKSLQVAVVCWLLAGWERSAEFTLKPDGWGWAEFGLSRSSIARGLNELERAGLISVLHRKGYPPIVTVLDHRKPDDRVPVGVTSD
jgi:hypothetical protein